MHSAAQLHSLQMNSILYYVIFSQHTSFVSMLTKEMLASTKKNYARFQTTIQCLEKLEAEIDNKNICHSFMVVLFFFFLSIDYKMRHWILNTQQTAADILLKDSYIQKKIEFVPGGSSCLSRHVKNPFLGQSVVFTPLHPHAAVSIMCTISREDFFDTIIATQTTESIHEVFDCIKNLVMLA